MDIETRIKSSEKEIGDLRSEVVFKQEKIFSEYLNNLLTEAFNIGRTYERTKWINKLDGCRDEL
jgi:hypothetical protein